MPRLHNRGFVDSAAVDLQKKARAKARTSRVHEKTKNHLLKKSGCRRRFLRTAGSEYGIDKASSRERLSQGWLRRGDARSRNYQDGEQLGPGRMLNRISSMIEGETGRKQAAIVLEKGEEPNAGEEGEVWVTMVESERSMKM